MLAIAFQYHLLQFVSVKYSSCITIRCFSLYKRDTWVRRMQDPTQFLVAFGYGFGLDDAFYNLLESKNGHISLIQLATVDAEFTRQYIEGQAKVFDATLEV